MLKKYCLSLMLCVMFFCGCSCNKQDLINENQEIKNKINELENENDKYENVGKIFSFYNTLTNHSVNSFVVVEASKTLGETKYGDGVVVASNGYYYYILADFNSIQGVGGYGKTKYRVMDSNASVYEAEIANVYDEESGLLLLRVDTSGKSNVSMKTIKLGEVSDLIAHVSSVKQMNKVQLSKNIKTNTIMFSDVSYSVYYFDDTNLTNGALLNIDNELCGIYLSNYQAFIDASLIRYILNTTYSLIL